MTKIVKTICVVVCVFFTSTSIAWSHQHTIATAIDRVNQELESALAASSAVRAAAIYTNEAQLLPPNSPIVSGNENIINFWQGAINQGVGGADLETVELDIISKDKAIEVGTFVIKNKEGIAIDNGKYLIIWQKENDQWKYHRDIWNSSNPDKNRH